MWVVPTQNHIFLSRNLHLAGDCLVLGLDGLHVLSGCISCRVGFGTENTVDKNRNQLVMHEIDIISQIFSFENLKVSLWNPEENRIVIHNYKCLFFSRCIIIWIRWQVRIYFWSKYRKCWEKFNYLTVFFRQFLVWSDNMMKIRIHELSCYVYIIKCLWDWWGNNISYSYYLLK